MQDGARTNQELSAELRELRERVSQLEKEKAAMSLALQMQRQKQEEISGGADRYRALFNTMVQGVVYQDSEGRIVGANAAALDILGVNLEQMQSRTSIDPRWKAIHEDGTDFPGESHPAMVALKTGTPVRDVVMGVYHLEDKEYRWLNVNAIPRFHPGECVPFEVYTTFEDITDKRKAEKDLERTRNILSEGEKIANMGTFEYLAANQTTVWSEEEYRIYGLDPSGPSPAYDVLLEKYIHPHDVSLLHETFTTAIQSGSAYELEHRIVRPDGSLRWVVNRAHPYFDESGELVRYIGTTLDVTERKQAEELLRKSEQRLALAANEARLGMFEWNTVTGETFCNDQHARLLGISTTTTTVFADYQYGDWAERVHPDDLHRVQKELHRCMTERVPFEAEYRIVWPDESVHWLAARGKFQYDSQGEPGCMHGIVLDISERKQAETSLKEARERLQIFIDHAPAALAMFDRRMRYLSVSRRWLSDYDLQDKDVIGRWHYDVFPDIPEEWKIAHRRALSGEVLRAEQDRFERTDGSLRWLRWEVRPWHDATGDIGGIVIFSEDITGQKESESALKTSLERVRHLNDVWGAIREISGLLNREQDERKLLNAVCECLVGTRGYVTVWIGQPEEASGEVNPLAHAGRWTDFVSHAKVRWDDSALGRGPAGSALRERSPVVFNDLENELRFAPWKESVLANGAGSIASIPLLYHERLFGVVTVRADKANAFDHEEVALLRELARDVARALQALEDQRERESAHAALRESEIKMRSIFRAAPMGIGLSSNRIMLEANEKLCEIVGYPRDELIGRNGRILYPTDQDYEYVGEEKYRQIEDAGTGTVETRFKRKDGRIIDVLLSSTPLDTADLSAGVTFTALDITDRKRAEEALRKAHSLLQNTFDASPDLLTVHDRNLRVVLSNWHGSEQVASEERTGNPNCYACHMGRHTPCEPCPTLEVFRTGRAVTMEVTNPRTQKILEVNAYPVLEASSDFELVTECVRDITEQKQAEETLRKSEERFRELAENIRDVFWVATHGELNYVSPACDEIWGVNRDLLCKNPAAFMELVHPDDRERVRQTGGGSFEAMVPLRQEYRIIRGDGEQRWIRVRSFPVWERGEIVRSVGIAEDITAVKEAEDLLRIQRDLAFGLGSAGGLQEAMEFLVEECLKLDHLDTGGIYLVEPETGALRLVIQHGLTAAFAERVSVHGPESPQARFARQGEPGYWSRPVEIFDTGDFVVWEGFASVAVIPVKSDGEVVAVLNLASHSNPEVPLNVRGALELMASHIGGLMARIRLIDTIRAQGERLQETNSALKALLRQREEDKTELEESLLRNVKHLILPYLEKMKGSRPGDDQKHFLEIIESHLREITSPFVRKISAPLLGLTPTEIRVADMIRQGKSSKEIADLLGISENSITFHRQGIRRKLGLTGKKLNLQTYLGKLE